MGFLQQYLSQYRLDNIPDSAKNILSKIEDEINTLATDNTNSSDFDICVKKFGPTIADISDRFAQQFAANQQLNITGITNTLKFVVSISTEIYQVIDQIKSCLNFTGTDAEIKQKQKAFGQELVYFVWMTVDPLKNQLNWVPFKKTIEKKVVFWLSGIALDHAIDLISSINVDNKPKIANQPVINIPIKLLK